MLGLGRARLTGEGSWQQGPSVPRFGLRLAVDRLSLPRASRAFREEAPSPPDSCVRSTRRPGGAIAPSIATQRIMLERAHAQPGWLLRVLAADEEGRQPRTKV